MEPRHFSRWNLNHFSRIVFQYLGFLFFKYILKVKRKVKHGKQLIKRLTSFFSFSRFSFSILSSSYLLVFLFISLLLYISFSSSFLGPGKSSQYKIISRATITKKCLIFTLLVIIIFSVSYVKKNSNAFSVRIFPVC